MYYMWDMRNFTKKQKMFFYLGLIIFLASIFRFAYISRHDAYTDETILGFRSVALMDYVTATYQTTPWQWVETVPWWMKLSFHDHPIFFFLTQHISFKIFGETLLALRLPSVLSGVGSVILIFYIARHFFGQRVGCLAAVLLSVQSYHLWLSRLGLQDGLVIFLMLLVLWLWIKTLETDSLKYWLMVGGAMGLGIITKYTIVIIIPILFLYAFLFKKKVFKNKKLIYFFLSAIVVSSPSWLYNFFLYHKFGHFDFQISAFLKQEVPRWAVRVGRSQVGGVADKFNLFFRALYQSNSQLFNFVAGTSFVVVLAENFWDRKKEIVFLTGSTFFMWFWFFIIGSTYRFVVMVVPFLILIIGYIFSKIYLRSKKLFYILASIFIFVEALFSYNTLFSLKPFGRQNIAYAQVREEAENFGYNQLGEYLDKILENKVSALFGQPDYQFLTDIQNSSIEKKKESGAEPSATVIIFNKQLNFLASLWTLNRHLIYDAWPVLNSEAFLSITEDRYDSFYRDQGVKEFIYITAAEGNFGVLDATIFSRNDLDWSDKKIKTYLNEKGVVPVVIKDLAGKDAFWVYHF